MIKVMHVDNVFEVFIFLILIFGYFFYARRGAYLIMFILLKTFSGASRHNASQKIFKIQATMQYHPINAGILMYLDFSFLDFSYCSMQTSFHWFHIYIFRFNVQ